MTWLQITVATDEEQANYIEGLLEDLSALSITLKDAEDNPVLEPDLGTTPLWQKTLITALFSADTAAAMVQLHLEQQGISAANITAEVIEDRDWEREWMTYFHPMQFGKKLWICPSWHTPEDPQAVNLMLDPGLAFGTGTHPTTSLCLTWLDSQNLKGKTITDYGCGSGVLAIASLLLGATSATGTDIDPQALEASEQNAHRNNVEHRLSLYMAEQMPENLQSDAVIANILAGPLISLAPTLAAMTRPGGSIALSGILKEQESEVSNAYLPFFELTASQYKDDWVLLAGVRHS